MVVKFDGRAWRESKKNIDRARREVQAETTRILRSFEGIPFETARFAQSYARGIAPYMTGTLFKAIKHTSERGNEATVFVSERILRTNRNLRDYNRSFNYAWWMHETSGDMGRGVRIKSGDPNFMDTTAKVVKQKLNRDIIAILQGKKGFR